MNRRVIWLTLLISLSIIFACALAAFLFYKGVTIPTLSTATQEMLQANNYATQTAISIAATQTLAAMPTSTLQPSPTVTPTAPPPQVTCNSYAKSASQAIYPVPGQGHNEIGEANSYVRIIGRLADSGWYKVEVDGKQGWMKSDSVSIEASCQPTTYDLHYLANWLTPDKQLIFEDLFATNTNVWLDAVTKINYLVKFTTKGEGQLEVNARKEALVTTTNPTLANLTAFTLYTSFTVSNVSDRSYVGVRFSDSGANYYQILLFPSNCIISVYTDSNLFYSQHMDPKACTDRYYDVSLAFSNDNHLDLQLNGFTPPVSINLQDPSGSYHGGGIKLVVNASDVQFDYLVILAPK